MSAEQIGQLFEVMHATKDVWKPVDPATDHKAEPVEDPSEHGDKTK